MLLLRDSEGVEIALRWIRSVVNMATSVHDNESSIGCSGSLVVGRWGWCGVEEGGGWVASIGERPWHLVGGTRPLHQGTAPELFIRVEHWICAPCHAISAHNERTPGHSAECTSSQCITLRTSGFCQLSHQCHQSPRTSTISPIIPVFSLRT